VSVILRILHRIEEDDCCHNPMIFLEQIMLFGIIVAQYLLYLRVSPNAQSRIY